MGSALWPSHLVGTYTRYGICWPVGANRYCRRWSPVALAGTCAQLVAAAQRANARPSTRCGPRNVCMLIWCPDRSGDYLLLELPLRVLAQTAVLAHEHGLGLPVSPHLPLQLVHRYLRGPAAIGI